MQCDKNLKLSEKAATKLTDKKNEDRLFRIWDKIPLFSEFDELCR